MIEIKPSELKKVVDTHYKTKTPLFIYGGFGIGKSTIVKDIAKAKATEKNKTFVEWNIADSETKKIVFDNPKDYFIFLDVRLSQFDITDLKGVPTLDKDNGGIKWNIPKFLEVLTNKDTDGFLFLDELNLANPSVLSACYQIIHDRVINEQKISDDTFIICAGNRAKDGGYTFNMPTPLRDRKSEVELITNFDEWVNYAIENNLKSEIIAFLNFRSDYLNKVDNDREVKPITPRGWFRVNKLLTETDLKDLNDVRLIVSSAIGEGVAREFIAFLKLSSKIDLDEILKNPESVNEIKQTDLIYSLISGLVNRFTQKPESLNNILKVCGNLSTEFGVLTLKMLKGNNETKFKNAVLKTDEWKGLSNKYGRFLL